MEIKNQSLNTEKLIDTIRKQIIYFLQGIVNDSSKKSLLNRLENPKLKLEVDFYLSGSKMILYLDDYETLDKHKFRLQIAKVYEWFNKYYNIIELLKDKNYLEFESHRIKMYKKFPMEKTWDNYDRKIYAANARIEVLQKIWDERMQFKMNKDPNKQHPSETISVAHTMKNFGVPEEPES